MGASKISSYLFFHRNKLLMNYICFQRRTFQTTQDSSKLVFVISIKQNVQFSCRCFHKKQLEMVGRYNSWGNMYTRLATSADGPVYDIMYCLQKHRLAPITRLSWNADAILLVISAFQAVLTIIIPCPHVKREVDIKILNRKMTKPGAENSKRWIRKFPPKIIVH